MTINSVTGSLPADGRTAVRPSTTNTYTLNAFNDAGKTATASLIVTVTHPVVSLDVTGITVFDSIDKTTELSVTANRSDGSRFAVESALVQWKTDDPWVATVSDGTVTAVAGGNTKVSASYQGAEARVLVSVRISERRPGTVRVLYAAPSDREFRSDYSEGITHALVDIQSWYRRELDGLTFALYDATPEFCQMSETSEFYGRGNAWDKVVAGVQHCAPVEEGDSDFVWVVYVDVYEACDEPHELGAGGWSLTIVARWDLEGLANPGEFYYCDEGPYDGTLGGRIGGMAHELAHTFLVLQRRFGGKGH